MFYHTQCFKGCLQEKLCTACSVHLPQENDDKNTSSRNIPELKLITDSKGLKVCHINIRGLLNNFYKLEEIIANFKLDMLLISETHLCDTITNSEIRGTRLSEEIEQMVREIE